jgi:hypothetical protein
MILVRLDRYVAWTGDAVPHDIKIVQGKTVAQI